MTNKDVKSGKTLGEASVGKTLIFPHNKCGKPVFSEVYPSFRVTPMPVWSSYTYYNIYVYIILYIYYIIICIIYNILYKYISYAVNKLQ